MELQEILQQVTEIFRSVLQKPELILEEDTTAADVDGWDSLSNIQLITSVEKHFGIKFKLREILKLKNVGELCTSVQKKVED
jgi:acyl carrier protein